MVFIGRNAENHIVTLGINQTVAVNKIVDKIIQNVKSFQEKQQDDMTLLVLKKLPSG